MSRNSVKLVVGRTCEPAEPIGLGFLRPCVTASVYALLTTDAGTWEAPKGTPEAEVAEKAAAVGLLVSQEFFEVPAAACEAFYGLPSSARPGVGSYQRIVPAAVLFDILHGLLIVGAPLLLIGLLRLVLTTRDERFSLRNSGRLCPRCGYEIGGLPAGSPCPECGAAA